MGGMGGMGGMMGEADAQNFAAMFNGAKLCGTCTVLSGQIKMTNAAGEVLTPDKGGLYVHHILTNARVSQSGFVNSLLGNAMGAGFVGAGDDNGNTPFIYTPRDGSLDSGFYVSPETGFTAQIVLVNYLDKPQQVYLNYDLEYLPGHVGKRVKSMLLSASLGNPRTSRSGAVNTTSSGMPFTESGTIVLAKGHLHDGGVAMYMRITGKNAFNCVSKATYGGKLHGSSAETISDMTDCNPGPVKVSVGDTMYMTAEYDIKAHPLRASAGGGGEGGSMGMFRVIFAPDRIW